jgi:hypothetical protein
MACTRIGVNSPQPGRFGETVELVVKRVVVSLFSVLGESSLSPPGQPHAQLASLFKIKRWSGRALAGAAVAAMLYCATDMVEFNARRRLSPPLSRSVNHQVACNE